MPMDTKSILDQIDAALESWDKLPFRHNLRNMPSSEAAEGGTLIAATIERVAPPGSRYRENVRAVLEGGGVDDPYKVATLSGILRALRADYEAGHLQAIHELIHADIFSDFLEMADHLLNEGYKDPAAIFAGGVLEEHLRKLAEKNGIATESGSRPKKADRMNADLAGANVYPKLDQKNVTAWLDLRNKAAHAKYGEYSKEQVALMVQSIRDFLSRTPA